ncbi:22586_t:CDS:2 [Dentiscutata erythropus]|uniref:22586_t:CDS:1 n=1 Tax=Dentiscutata erythropus TaxID=1348616 RepID=A0A9N8YV44_9GLOM|nr:22586_t:CDS:2 [Dentiscutata erythropus]
MDFLLYWIKNVDQFDFSRPLYHITVDALLDSKLYTISGTMVFCFDLSKPLDASFLMYDLLPMLPVFSMWGTAGINGSKVFLIGGVTTDINIGNLSDNLIYSFDAVNHEWAVPEVAGVQPLRRREASSTFDPATGWIYIFGGATVRYNYEFDKTEFFNDFIILDSTNLSWISIDSFSFNIPTKRASHTATLIENGIIVFIGGYEVINGTIVQDVDINQIWTYEIKSGTWKCQYAVGDKHPMEISSSMAVVILMDQDPHQTLLYLMSKTIPFQWSAPSIPPDNAPPSLAYHTATIFENYMFIFFGNITNDFSEPLDSSMDFYIFDTISFTWVTSNRPFTASQMKIIRIIGIIMHVALAIGFVFGWEFSVIN